MSSTPRAALDIWNTALPITRLRGGSLALSWVAAALGVGVLIVALAFAASRAGLAPAGPMFWTGEGILFAAPAMFLLRRGRVSRADALTLAWLLPLATYVIVEAYSPGQFRFLDEFLTLRTTASIAVTHHLFQRNAALLVSPQYPGLEIVTEALSLLAHLPLETAGTIVVGASHVTLGLAVCLLMLELTGRPRLAGLATLVYATGPLFQFFDSYFVYGTLALPLMVASLLAAVKLIKSPPGSSAVAWGAATLLLACATVVTHHVTSYALVGLMLVLAVGNWASAHGAQTRWRLPTVLVLTCAFLCAWDLGVATATVAYFSSPLVATAHGLAQLVTGHPQSSRVSLPAGPAFDLTVQYISIALVVALSVAGAYLTLRRQNHGATRLSRAFAVGAVSLAAGLLLRASGSGGSQLWGRSSTYFMLPVSLTVATALARISVRTRLCGSHAPSALARRIRHWTGVLALVTLGIGGIAGGWPAYYARLPGSFRIEAWERSVDARNLALAAWGAHWLPPGYGVAADFQTGSLLASIGHEAAPSSVGALFLTPHITSSDRELVRTKRISYVVVDLRMATQLPADGAYFADDPRSGRYRAPLPLADLLKFRSVPGMSCIFDDGTIAVYQIAGSTLQASGG